MKAIHLKDEIAASIFIHGGADLEKAMEVREIRTFIIAW